MNSKLEQTLARFRLSFADELNGYAGTFTVQALLRFIWFVGWDPLSIVEVGPSVTARDVPLSVKVLSVFIL